MTTDDDALMVAYLDGRTSADEDRRLDERLRHDPALRRRFVATAALTGMLAESVRTGAVLPPERSRWRPRILVYSGIAAAVAAAGMVLSWRLLATAAPPLPVVATLVALHGAVAIDRAGTALVAAVGTDLAAADRVSTAGDGGLTLVWRDGSRSTLAAGSAMRLDPGHPDAGRPDAVTATLDRGSIDCDIRHRGPGDAPFAIAAGTWRVVDLGTTFTVTMAANGPQVAVTRGAVEVHAGATTAKILADQDAVADAHGDPRVAWTEGAVAYGTADHPFAADARWNAPIPPGTTRGAALPGLAVAWATTGAGLTVLRGNAEMHEVFQRGASTVIGTMPEVPGLTPDQVNHARVLIVIGPDGRTAWEARETELRGDHRIAARHLATVDLTGTGEDGGLLSGYSAFGGLITDGDLAGGIPHALALYLPQAMQTAAGVQVGDRLAVDETATDPGPVDPAAAVVANALLRALRAHGAVVVGAGAAAQVAVDARMPAAQQAMVAAAMTRFAPALRKVP